MRIPLGLRAAAGNQGAPEEPTDADFKQTVLLLHGDGTNGAQNNTFVDSSSNNFTITRNGNTTQGTFTPFSAEAGKWSNYFDGTGDFLSLTPTSALNFAGDFTVECWFYPTLVSATEQAIVDTRAAGGAQGYFIAINTSTGVTRTTVANSSITSNTTVTTNTWNHFAVCRSGSTIRTYVNGVQQSGSATNSTTVTTYLFNIGAKSFTSSSFINFNGYISNFRVVNGTAVYTASFTPPTAPLTTITNTSLLTCQNNQFVDGSSNNFAITRNGDVRVTPFSPFSPSATYSPSVNGGSGYFDGSGDYLSVVHNSVFNYGTSDFTIEFWVYPIAPGQSGFTVLYAKPNSGGYSGIAIIQNASSYNVGVYASTSGTSWNLINNASCGTLIPFSWNHIAVTRSGSNVYAFLNGTLRSTTNVSTSSLVSTTDPVLFGSSRGNASTFYTGYMSNSRIVTGTALYTADFTPPTALLTAITNTSLLLNFTNAGIIDSTGKNVLETIADAQLDTTVKKYGTASLEFDASGDGLFIPSSPDIQFLTGDFTVELWGYIKTGATNTIVWYDNRSPNTANLGFQIESGHASGVHSLSVGTSGTNWISVAAGLGKETWYHIAFTRSGNTFRLFLDGTLLGTFNGSATQNFTNSVARIGYGVNSTSGNCFIDDLRVTKGIARYTSAFTPPTAAFADK